MANVPFSLFRSRYGASRNYIQIRSQGTTNSTAHPTVPIDLRPTEFDKRILVWGKKFPSVDSVPSRVPRVTMDRARNAVRIKINILTMVVGAIGCFGVIMFSKYSPTRGTLTKMNQAWHEEYNAKMNAKEQLQKKQ